MIRSVVWYQVLSEHVNKSCYSCDQINLCLILLQQNDEVLRFQESAKQQICQFSEINHQLCTLLMIYLLYTVYNSNLIIRNICYHMINEVQLYWNISFLEHSNFGTINFGTFGLRSKINRVPKLVRLQYILPPPISFWYIIVSIFLAS